MPAHPLRYAQLSPRSPALAKRMLAAPGLALGCAIFGTGRGHVVALIEGMTTVARASTFAKSRRATGLQRGVGPGWLHSLGVHRNVDELASRIDDQATVAMPSIARVSNRRHLGSHRAWARREVRLRCLRRTPNSELVGSLRGQNVLLLRSAAFHVTPDSINIESY